MHPTIYMLEKEFIEHKMVTRIPFFVLVCMALVFISLLMKSGDNVSYQMSFSGDMAQDFSIEVDLFIASFAGFISLLLSTLYLPKTLRKERQEGSAMFWRSMPVSHATTHAVKLAFGLLVIPLICSLLVLAANIMLWILGDSQLMYLFELNSLFDVVLNWGNYLLRMMLVAIAVLPLACIALMISQVVSSPILVMFIGGFAIKWLSVYLLGFYGIDHFFSAILSMPAEIFSVNPFSAFTHAGFFNLVIYYLLGTGALFVSLALSQTNEVSLKGLFSRR